MVLKYLRKLIPFAVLAGRDDDFCLIFESLQDDNLSFQLDDRLCGCRVIDQAFLEVFLLLGTEVIIILGNARIGLGSGLAALDPELFITKSIF